MAVLPAAPMRRKTFGGGCFWVVSYSVSSRLLVILYSFGVRSYKISFCRYCGIKEKSYFCAVFPCWEIYLFALHRLFACGGGASCFLAVAPMRRKGSGGALAAAVIWSGVVHSRFVHSLGVYTATPQRLRTLGGGLASVGLLSAGYRLQRLNGW